VSDVSLSRFQYDPDPANPGWMIWGPRGGGVFNAHYNPVLVREDGPGSATVRCFAGEQLTSASGYLHGGATAGFIDIALFAGARGCGLAREDLAVTLDLTIQYLAPGRSGQNLDAKIDLVRETKRIAFIRGLLEQEDGPVASFMATVRKGSPRP
jgi:uncharacterized protein (TIGR00369 family)